MKLDRDSSGGNLIQNFSGGSIVIGTEVIGQPVIVTSDRIVRDWSPPPVHELALADFRPVLDLEPEVILLGTGQHQCFPSMAFTTAVLRLGVGLEIMTTAAACRTYNVMVSEYRRVAAALFVR